MVLRDDLGSVVDVSGPARRVVSLVPSLTEAFAATRSEALVGATDWCTHPAELDVTRVRGTKNPDVKRIIELRADLVVVNQEENRELDVRRLREAGVLVWVTVIQTVPQALDSMARLFDEALQWGTPPWLTEATAAWAGPLPAVRTLVAVPIWREPWMVVGRDTFTGDLLRRLGAENVYTGHADRYPTVTVEEIDASGADLVLLPDEPYVFTPADGPEAFARTPTRLVSGRLLTWYGPSLLEAARLEL